MMSTKVWLIDLRVIRMKRLLACSFLVFVCSLSGAPSLAAQNLMITNARILDGKGGRLDRGTIVVRTGRIASVSPDAAAAADLTVVDARGMTVMPGFIDAHRHVMSGNDDRWFKEQSVTKMQEFLEAGYTTL